jgi:hypothetical protein
MRQKKSEKLNALHINEHGDYKIQRRSKNNELKGARNALENIM